LESDGITRLPSAPRAVAPEARPAIARRGAPRRPCRGTKPAAPGPVPRAFRGRARYCNLDETKRRRTDSRPILASAGAPALAPRFPNVIGCGLSDSPESSCPRKRASMPAHPSASPHLDSLYHAGHGRSSSPQAAGQSEGRRGAAPSGLAAAGRGAINVAPRRLQLVENCGRGGGRRARPRPRSVWSSAII